MKQREYEGYEEYRSHQIAKTANPATQVRCAAIRKRREKTFRKSFLVLNQIEWLPRDARGLCLGARFGEEVRVLRAMGYTSTIGIDLVECPPLVLRGDFHCPPVEPGAFDFVFSNALDHVYNMAQFVSGVNAATKARAAALFHVAVQHMDEFESLYIESPDEVVEVMDGWELVTHTSCPYESDKLVALLFARGQ